jgi:Family of unknown function (DUF6335)
MAKRRRQKTQKTRKRVKRPAKTRKRPAAKRAVRRPAKRPAKRVAKRAAKRSAKRPSKKTRDQVETLRTPPSSLDMARTATAARSGRKAQGDNLRRHSDMGSLSGGDADGDMESAYFSGDEAPGGDNPTPDQQDVDDIGHALGVQYQDNQELQGGEEVVERDKHRWDNE